MSDSENSLLSFDENSRPVQTEAFDFESVCQNVDGEEVTDHAADSARERIALILDVFDWALSDGNTAERVGRRVLCACYLFRDSIPGSPKSLSELGARLGVTKQSAHECLTHFRAELLAKRQEWAPKA